MQLKDGPIVASPTFLGSLKPAATGALPNARLAHRWLGQLEGLVVFVGSTTPDAGISAHVVADRHGNWVAYEHARGTNQRWLLGCSDPRGSRYLLQLWGLPWP